MNRPRITRISPLELAMRDARDAVAEYSMDLAYDFAPGSFEILPAEEASPPPTKNRKVPRAQVILHPRATHCLTRAD